MAVMALYPDLLVPLLALFIGAPLAGWGWFRLRQRERPAVRC